MSETPRTDAEFKLEAFFDGVGIAETVLVEFAQQLETELADKDRQLAEARAEIEQKDKLIEQAQTLLNAVVAGDCYIACIDVDGKNWFDVRDALAAERGER